MSPADAEVQEGDAERKRAIQVATAAADQVREGDVAPDGLAEEPHSPKDDTDLAEAPVAHVAAVCAGQPDLGADADAPRREHGESGVWNEHTVSVRGDEVGQDTEVHESIGVAQRQDRAASHDEISRRAAHERREQEGIDL